MPCLIKQSSKQQKSSEWPLFLAAHQKSLPGNGLSAAITFPCEHCLQHPMSQDDLTEFLYIE